MTISDLLRLRDLTDPAEGPHAIQLVVDAIEQALAGAWRIPVRREPGHRIVSIADNYDRLHYRSDAVARDRRYSHYVDGGRMLRSHTTAGIPPLLDKLAAAVDANPADADPGVPTELLLSLPGICYRRDAIGRRHVGEPHQLDLWRIRRCGPPLTEVDLTSMVGLVVGAVLPGHRWWMVPNTHPYTLAGREIYVGTGDDGATAVEIGECGLAHPGVLSGAGLDAGVSGLAMGLGLDRLTMLAKGIEDIRLLRSNDARVVGQMLDLSRYRPVSAMPPARRDMSIAVADDLDTELLGDRIRQVLGPDAEAVEEVSIRSATSYADLPASARHRIGIRPGQRNVLLRLVLRDLSRT
ncbi:MAG TPA: hypothetical protein VF163_20910, partial [Micromonosporaceae bacterium]